MSYEPRTYWQDRALAQGPTYVGPGGREERTAPQTRVFEALLREQIAPCGTLLDFGCGSGRFSELLSGLCKHYIGVDLAPAALDYARRVWPKGDFRLATDGIPVDDASVDVIVSLTVLQHIVAPEDWQRTVAELRRVLVPGGRIFACEEWYGDNPTHPHVTRRHAADYKAAFGADIEAVGRVAGARAFWVTPC